MNTWTRSAVLSLSLVAASHRCMAQALVKQEPLDGRSGATVFVDDGTCPKGAIKQVTYTHGNAMSGAPLRATKCVPTSAVR
jgi:hypothetical protein